MMINKIIILVAFLSFSHLYAKKTAEEPASFPKKITNKNKVMWTAVSTTKKGIEYLEIIDKNKKTILSQPSDYAIHGVVDAEAFNFKGSSNNYIIAIWSKGAHGQNVKILQPGAKKQVLYSFNSSWPLGYTIKDQKIIIEATGDMNDNGRPDVEMITWGPKGFISKKTIKPVD
jgi:hypothetical protein